MEKRGNRVISECAPGESFLVSLHIPDLSVFHVAWKRNSGKRNEIREMFFPPVGIKSTLDRVYNTYDN